MAIEAGSKVQLLSGSPSMVVYHVGDEEEPIALVMFYDDTASRIAKDRIPVVCLKEVID